MKTVPSYKIAFIMNDLNQAVLVLSNMPSSPLRDLAYRYADEAAARMREAFLADVQVEAAREVEAV